MKCKAKSVGPSLKCNPKQQGRKQGEDRGCPNAQAVWKNWTPTLTQWKEMIHNKHQCTSQSGRGNSLPLKPWILWGFHCWETTGKTGGLKGVKRADIHTVHGQWANARILHHSVAKWASTTTRLTMKAITKHNRTQLSHILHVTPVDCWVTPLTQNTDLYPEFSHVLLVEPSGLQF